MALTYSYPPIPSPRSIRILHLEPAVGIQAPLYGTLTEADLDTHPSYEALSYVWGKLDPSTQDVIHLETTSDRQGTLAITMNCGAALRHIRREKETRKVWVDAICINQRLDAEKSEQVQMMRDIYYRAHQVLVWLDLDPGINARDYQRVVALAERLMASFRRRLLLIDGDDSQSSDNESSDDDSNDASSIDGIDDTNTQHVSSLSEGYFDYHCGKLGGRIN